VANPEYIESLRAVIGKLHNCGATWLETVPVHEMFQGKTVWKGEVEVFDLQGHPQATRAYGWSHREGPNDKGERFVTVLEIPPVDSPKKAVQVSVLRDIKAARK
jgi:hypothetical protein